MAKTNSALAINPMFDGIFSCQVCAIPNGPNETETFKSGNNINIQ